MDVETEDKIRTIQIYTSTADKLNALKKFKDAGVAESYDDVINRLIQEHKNNG